MNYIVFISFPSDVEEFQADDKTAYDDVIKELTRIKSLVRHQSCRFFFDSENVETFINLADFVEEASYLGTLRNRLRRLLSNASTNLSAESINYGDLHHYRWSQSETQYETNLILKNACESIEDGSNVIVINFNNHLEEVNECISILRDSQSNLALPELRKIPYSINSIEFNHWLKSTYPGVFNLRDTSLFKPTQYRWKKQRIYFHLEMKQYWYYDYYHKDNKEHFEVFNEDGTKHLGEADINGTLDSSKIDVNKKISDIIN